MEIQDFNKWLKFGLDNKWASPSYCETHDSTPLTLTEEEDSEEMGENPCIHVLRLFETPALWEEAKANNHYIFRE
jgi:hypothetical protein